MAFYLSDNNMVALINESGTYANVTGATLGVWIGNVQSSTINEDVGVLKTRYAGVLNRNVGQFVDGPISINGTISYYPTDFRMALYALGSVVDSGSPSPYAHVAGELNNGSSSVYISGTTNPFTSFTIEEAKRSSANQHFIRTVNGCVVNSWSINAAEGQPLTCTVDYVGRIQSFGSVTPATFTDPVLRPFMWSDVTVHIPSGTIVDETKSFTASINNNLQTFHFVNGSRYISNPIPTNREYEIALTVNAKSETAKTFYDSYFIAGSTFNMMIGAVASTGSRTFYWIFSGCKMTALNTPTPAEGVQEITMTINPQNSVFNSDDLIFKWGPF